MLKAAPILAEDIAISGGIKTCVYDPNGNDAER